MAFAVRYRASKLSAACSDARHLVGKDVVSDSQSSRDDEEEELLGSQLGSPGFSSQRPSAAHAARSGGGVGPSQSVQDRGDDVGCNPSQVSPSLRMPLVESNRWADAFADTAFHDSNGHDYQRCTQIQPTLDLQAEQACDVRRWRHYPPSTQCTPDVRCTAETAVSQAINDLSGTPPLKCSVSTGDTEVLPHQQSEGFRRSQSTQQICTSG